MKMSKLNKDNIKIVKDISEELVSTYIKIGWKEEKENKINKTKSFFEKPNKEDKEENNENINI